MGPLSLMDGALTSDKDVGRVGFISRLGDDTQGVETLILFVEVCERQCGLVSTPVHVSPFGWGQQNIWKQKNKAFRTEIQ